MMPVMIDHSGDATLDSGFLGRIRWVEAVVEMEALDRLSLPPFAGSAIRGALGRIFRPALCDAAVKCVEDCAMPSECRYYSLFEQSRAGGGTGSNIPKPMILGAPLPGELEILATGGEVEWPYEVGKRIGSESIPTLRNESDMVLEPGANLRFELRLIGNIAAAVPAIIEGLARYGIGIGGGRLKLRRVWDTFGANRVIHDWANPGVRPQAALERTLDGCRTLERAKRVRIVFLTPAMLKIGSETCFDPEVLARECLKQCMVRAMQVYHGFFAHGQKLPWMELPEMGVRLAEHRLFHYVLPRRSFRQERWMNFDGLVGFMDLSGDLTPALPFLRAAEFLNIGQKATFGLGRIRAFVLE